MLLYFRRRLRSQGRRWNSCRSRGRSCVTRTKSCRCCWRTCGQAGTVSCRSPTRSGPAFGNLLSGKAEQQCCCRSDRPASPNTWAGKKPLSFADLCFSASWHAVRKITRPGLEPGTTEPKSVVLPLHHRVTWTSAESVVAQADTDFAEFQTNFIQ